MSRCRTCGASIVWRVNNVTGRRAPIDAEPDPNGNIELLGDGKTYRVIRPQTDLFTDPGTPLHLNHWATCPTPPARQPEKIVDTDS